MDPISITTGCLSLMTCASHTITSLNSFVRDFRSARQELDGVKRELVSLESVVTFLREDCEAKEKREIYTDKDDSDNFIPESLRTHVTNILRNCITVIQDIDEWIEDHKKAPLGAALLWTKGGGRGRVMKLRSTLEAHRGALDIALELVNM
jgi:hypothetical protein